MGLAIYWTKFAENKLVAIYNFYKKEAGARIAKKLVQGIVEQTVALKENPFIGKKEPLLKNRTQEFRYLVFKKYKIIYWINKADQRIDIANVFDCRQNPEKMKEIE